MRDVRWTESALAALTSLGRAEQQALLDRLELTREFPEMYPARRRGRFAGLRYFVVNRRWLIYYLTDTDRLVVIAIIPALARPA